MTQPISPDEGDALGRCSSCGAHTIATKDGRECFGCGLVQTRTDPPVAMDEVVAAYNTVSGVVMELELHDSLMPDHVDRLRSAMCMLTGFKDRSK